MSEEHGARVDAESEARALVGRLRTLVLATIEANGDPQASYAPFVERADAFHVFVSGLAAHTANLIERRRAGVLLIEDESSSPQLFARTRLSLECTVHELAAGAPGSETVLDAFGERFGNVMALIRPLPDFRLLRLVPVRGSFVRGFGQAYAFDGPALTGFTQLDESAVRRRAAGQR